MRESGPEKDRMIRRSIPLAFLLLLPTLASAGEAVAPVASYTVETVRRTLRKLPLKRIITSERGWRRVTRGLSDPPPKPDFTQHECVLVVADARGGAKSWIERVERRENGELLVVLHRQETETSLDTLPRLKSFFLLFPAPVDGVRLEHRTLLEGIGGFIERSSPAVAADRDPRQLPALGPDLRLSCVMADGSPPPEGLKLRWEAHFRRQDLPGKVKTIPFPTQGLPFPRIRDEVHHVYAAHAAGFRSRNPLVIRRLPPLGADGSPRPIVHVFRLEPVPQRPR
jgi:hypothetical protein